MAAALTAVSEDADQQRYLRLKEEYDECMVSIGEVE